MSALYELCGTSRQGHWDAVGRLERSAAKEPCYVGLIVQVREMHPGMGLRVIYEQFSPEGIGRDAFVALGIREGFRLHTPVNHQRTTYSVKSNRFKNLLVDKWVTGVNQVWVSDLFYFAVDGKHYYVVLLMDVYSRRIVGYSVADNMRAENNLHALDMALSQRGVAKYGGTLIHHSDRGSQYTSDDYTNLLEYREIQISMCANVLENAHSERANGTIKNYYLNGWGIASVGELFKRVPEAVENYNNRVHQSLDMSPVKYEEHIKTLAPDKRTQMEMFTMKQNVQNPNQLSLIFES